MRLITNENNYGIIYSDEYGNSGKLYYAVIEWSSTRERREIYEIRGTKHPDSNNSIWNAYSLNSSYNRLTDYKPTIIDIFRELFSHQDDDGQLYKTLEVVEFNNVGELATWLKNKTSKKRNIT